LLLAVRKGELLGTLESFEFIQLQQDYLQNNSQLSFLSKEMDRQKTLNAENVGARKNYEQAEANFRSTKALVQSLEAKLLMLGISASTLGAKGVVNATVAITSPVDGYVSAENVNLGKQTVAGEPLFEIVDKSHMHIELTVFEKDAPRIKEEQKVSVQMNDGSEKIMATVHLVGKVLEGEARTLNIHAHINNKKSEERLIPGAYVNALIMTGSRLANVVPMATVVRKGENGFIFSEIKSNEFKRIPVQIGLTTDSGNVEITSKENLENLQLVTKGAYLLDAEFAKRSEPAE
jgi:cobalt-zinc-cadmium efflux system membrane fusion protein